VKLPNKSEDITGQPTPELSSTGQRRYDMIDWDNLTKEEYQDLVRSRQLFERQLAQQVMDFEWETGLEVEDIRLIPPNPLVPVLLPDGTSAPNDKITVQVLAPMRILFFD
jgi:hypothetical protein